MSLGELWATLDELLLPMLRDYRDQLGTLDVIEKDDKTLLSEADLAVQRTIADTITAMFPGSGFVAEEDDVTLVRAGSPLWVVDPIDGTAEFVNPQAREYCSVVCRLDDGIPSAAYVLAPELGAGGSPIAVHWASDVRVNGTEATALPARPAPERVSATRGKGTEPRPFEARLAHVKLRTTSQTLDMLRTCVDLSAWTNAPDQQFDVFYRPRQKVWDGIAGIGLARAMGRLVVDGAGRDPLPLGAEFLADRTPIFAETISGDPACVRWFLDVLRS